MRMQLNVFLRTAIVVATLFCAAFSVGQDLTPTVSMNDLSGSVGQTVTLRASVSQGGRTVSNTRVVFRVNQRFIGAATTNGSGVAEMPYTVPMNLGNSRVELMASLGGSNYVKRTLAVQVPEPSLLLENLTAFRGESVVLSSVLRKADSSAPIRNANVTFEINGIRVGFARTDQNGQARFVLRLPASLAPGVYRIDARFRGSASLAATAGTAQLVVRL